MCDFNFLLDNFNSRMAGKLLKSFLDFENTRTVKDLLITIAND